MTTILRVLCFLLDHPWQMVWFPKHPVLFGRVCPRCDKRERKLGNSWLPAGKDWGGIDG